MSKKENLKRWMDDHRRGKAPLYVTEVLYAIINALPDEEEPEPEGADQPKQTPPPIGPVEARGYADESLRQGNMCVAQNAHMISLLSDIRDALVRTQLPGLDSKPESDPPDLWEGHALVSKDFPKSCSFCDMGTVAGWHRIKVREVRE